MTAALPLPAPTGAALARAAISAAEALRLFAVTLGRDPETVREIDAHVADVAQRSEEARVACQVLGSTLEDTGRSSAKAYEIAGRVRLDDNLTLDDLAGYEAWCREIAAEVQENDPHARGADFDLYWQEPGPAGGR